MCWVVSLTIFFVLFRTLCNSQNWQNCVANIWNVRWNVSNMAATVRVGGVPFRSCSSVAELSRSQPSLWCPYITRRWLLTRPFLDTILFVMHDEYEFLGYWLFSVRMIFSQLFRFLNDFFLIFDGFKNL